MGVFCTVISNCFGGGDIRVPSEKGEERTKEMRQRKKFLTAEAVLLAVSILVLTGCGKAGEDIPHTETAEASYDIPEAQSVADDGGEQDEAWEKDTGEEQDTDTAKVQSDEQNQGAGTDIIVHKTQEEWDAQDRAERAELEAKVKAAGGISEEEAIEIARKAMEEDIGEKAEGMRLRPWQERLGWKTDLCIADWGEIKEEDRGALGYYMQFDDYDDNGNTEDGTDYHCTVNAVDGSILEAYQIEVSPDGSGGYSFDSIYYEH